MQKEEYQLQDVVFGLRPEYLKLRGKLEQLGNYVNFPQKEISNLSFYVTNRDSKMLLWCQFKRNRPWFLEKMAKVIGLEQKLFFPGKVNKIDQHWQMEGIEASSYPISDSAQFDKAVDEIAQMPFVQDGKTKITRSNQQEFFFSLWALELLNPYFSYSPGMMQYHPEKDQIFLSPQPKFDQLDWILRTKIPRELFSPYQQSLIDQYIAKQSRVLVEDAFTNLPSYYTIEEEPGLTVLKKVNLKKKPNL